MKNLIEYMRIRDSVYLCDEENNLYYKKTVRAKPIKLSLFRGHFYNFRVYKGVPVLEIDGLRMQVMKGFVSPLDYAEMLVRTLGIRKGYFILDTCTGLGYTAVAAAKKGARVVTIEYSDAVLELARYNPLGQELFENKNIKIINGDAAEKLKDFPNGVFDCIIHDPPRMSHAPQLYSTDFYKELKRVLRPRGKIYHYVGSFGARKLGRNIAAEISRRLVNTTFRKIRYFTKLQGIIAIA